MPQPPILVDAKLSMQKFYNGFVNFIKSNSNEKTVLNYFDERDVYPMFFKGTIQEDVLWANLLNRVGKPMLFSKILIYLSFLYILYFTYYSSLYIKYYC